MPLFKCNYQSINTQGVRYIFAKNTEEAKQKMLQKNLLVTNINEVSLFMRYGNKTQELERIFWQLEFSYTSGLHLISILQSIKKELYFKENAALLQSMIHALEKGDTLSSALQKHINTCGSLVVALFSIGEKSGFLQETCELCAKEISQKNSYIQALRNAMIYPLLLALSFLCVFFVLAFFVIPEFASLYNELGANLPFLTELTLKISSFLQSYIFEILACILIFIIFCFIFLNKKLVRDRILLHTPFINHVVTDYWLYIYFLGLHYFLKSKVPFMDSIVQCEKLIHNSVLQQKISHLRFMLDKGIPLSQALNSIDIKIANIALLQSGEQSGMLDKALELNARFYKDRFTQSLQTLQILSQPFTTIIMGILIAGLAYSIVAPMWQLLEVAI